MFHTLFATALTSNTSTAKDQLGIIRAEYSSDYGFRYYKYVAVASDTTVANGTVLGYTDDNRCTVTSDISDTNANFIAGVGIGAITASYYGWIQVKGFHSAVLTDGGGDIAAGDVLIMDSSTDGTCDSIAGSSNITQIPLGVAQAADTTETTVTVPAYLHCEF